MKFLRLTILSAGILVTAVGLFAATAVAATATQQTTQTDATKTDATTTGFPTGTTCKQTGIYRAGNKYLEVILVLGGGRALPSFC